MLAIENESWSRVNRAKELGGLHAHHFVDEGSLALAGIDRIGSVHLAVRRWLVTMSLTLDQSLSMPFSSCSDQVLRQNGGRDNGIHAKDGGLVLAEKHDGEEMVLCFFSRRPHSDRGREASF